MNENFSNHYDYDIFISYSRADIKTVSDIVNRFEREGYRVWIDKDGIESGDAFKSTIVSAIERSAIFVFFSSENSNKSEWTAKEIGIANARKKVIIPIKLDHSNYNHGVEFDLINLDYIDYSIRAERSSSIDKLVKTLNRKLGKGKNADIHTTEGQNTNKDSEKGFSLKLLTSNRKGCIISVAILSVLCVFIPTYFFHSNIAMAPPVQYDMAPTDSVITSQIQAIDLGLPSGTLWANMNIGARSEKECGNLYSWGETSPKGSYAQAQYSNPAITKIIGTPYDVAHQELGMEWQMPTESQFKELILCCTWKWESTGFKVSGKNGNYIFLPATGWSCSSTVEYRGKFGYYWTGDKVNSTFAKGLLFSKPEQKTGNGYLYYGRAIRAVRK